MSAMMRVGLLILVCMPMVLLASALYRARPHPDRAQDAVYAQAVFGGILPYTDVIASGTMGYVGGTSGAMCDYVIVRLPEGAPSQPPAPDFARDAQNQFGGLWQASPGVSVLKALPSPLDQCARLLMPQVQVAVHDAMTNTQSWLARDPGKRAIHVYAPKLRLAARIGIRK
jgi:hypothetical protein